MSKFVIEKISIDKSNKDIKIGSYSLAENFNLICGKNEAGKSTLMKFLKEGFFKKNKLAEKGQIVFKIKDDKSEGTYIADIDVNSKEKCKITDANSGAPDYSLIGKTIDENYYNQGFTINLDDLSNIDKDDKLLNAIKDPSGDKLKKYTDNLIKEISNNVGVNSRAKKPLSDIVKEIKNINKEIENLKNLENDYSEAIREKKSAEIKLKKIDIKEKYLLNLKKIKEQESKLEKIEIEIKEKECNFNEKLAENSEEYSKIIQESGVYKNCIDTLEFKNKKLEEISEKISGELDEIKTSTGINATEELISNFNCNNESIKEIDSLISQNNNARNNKKNEQNRKAEAENKISDLNREISSEYSENMILQNECDIKKAKKYIEYLELKLSEYNYKIQPTDIMSGKNTERKTDKIILVIFILLMLISLSASIVLFLNQNIYLGAITAIVAIIAFFGVIYELVLKSKKELNQNNKEHLEEIEKILKEIKEESVKYNPNIKDIANASLVSCVKNIKQKLEESVKKHYEKDEQIKKRDECDKNIKNEENTIEENNKKIKELMDKEYRDIEPEKYLEFLRKIESLQISINQKRQINDEINKAKVQINEINKQFGDFIKKTDIAISPENFLQKIEQLKEITEKNNETKKNIELKQVEYARETDYINELINANEELKENFKDDISEDDIDIQLENLKEDRNRYKKEKEDSNAKKIKVEQFEGLGKLKIEKNEKIAQYRKKVKELVISQLTLDIINKAKEDFNKTQPDLEKAEKYLKILTAGKYTKINLEYKNVANDNSSILKEWSELSRGTKEQLYLALRLGYASNYTKDKITREDRGVPALPLILDDIFVNFDTERTKNALECLLNFSKNNQVLLFTCHEEEYEKLLNEIKAEDEINSVKLD